MQKFSKENCQAAVIGAGQMGCGIAQVLACSGMTTQLYDIEPNFVSRGIKSIEDSLTKLEKKNIISGETRAIALKSISPAHKLSQLETATVIVEAIAEDEQLKIKLFGDISQIVATEALVATNTSSISITRLARAVTNPERFIGLHFMNPAPLMPLVEIVKGLQTTDHTHQFSANLVEHLGKQHITALRDYPGFIVNRILVPMLNEAFFALMEGVAAREEIDQAMKLGTNHPMGPLELADLVGLDTCLAIMRIFHQEFGDSKYRPCPLLVKYVEAGWLGRKTGRGVYDYL